MAPNETVGRWRVAWMGFLVLVVCGGTHFYAFPVLMEPIRATLGTSLTAVSATIFVWGLVGAVASPRVGGFIAAAGPRRAVAAGTLLQAGSFLVVASSSSLIQVYVGFALAAIALCANTYIAVSAAVAAMFDRQQGRAMGVAMLGLGVGGLLVPIATERLLSAWSWQQIYGAYAGLVLLMVPLFWWGLAPSDRAARSPTVRVDSGQAGQAGGTSESVIGASRRPADLLRTRSFWGLAIGDGLTGLIFAFFTVHFLGVAAEAGVPSQMAASWFGIFLFLASPGTVLIGWAADRFAVRPLVMLCYALPVILVPTLFALPNPLALATFALVPGFLAGGRAAIFPLAIAWAFGKGQVARAYGWLNVAFLIGTAVGPVASGWLVDRSGSYNSSIWAAWIVGALSVAWISLVRREPGWSDVQPSGAG